MGEASEYPPLPRVGRLRLHQVKMYQETVPETGVRERGEGSLPLLPGATVLRPGPPHGRGLGLKDRRGWGQTSFSPSSILFYQSSLQS